MDWRTLPPRITLVRASNDGGYRLVLVVEECTRPSGRRDIVLTGRAAVLATIART
jgi:hypothetical protein